MISNNILRPLFQAVVFCLGAQSLSAAIFGKFSYDDTGTSITVTGCDPSATGAVVIPPTIIGKPVTAIGNGAFAQCWTLTSVHLPNSVTIIGNDAFEQCWYMSRINLPDGITSIGEGAFATCASLASIIIPERLTVIGKSAFDACNSLSAITVDAKNPAYCSEDGVLFNHPKTRLIKYPARKAGSYIIPDSVIAIEADAFDFCRGLTRITIPDSVTSIGRWAFNDCTSLKSVTLPNRLTSIRDTTFSGCIGLKSVTIPNRVTSIEAGAFSGCSGLTRAVFLGNAPSLVAEAFADCASSFTVYYLKGKTGFTSPRWHGYRTAEIIPAPEIAVQQPVGSNLVDGVTKKGFGTAMVGMTGTSKTFTIKNTGTANLTGLAITKSETQKDDFIITAPATTWLAPGATITFKVTFKPTATGTRSAAIHIKSNDANENPFDIQLSGLGVVP